MIVTIERRISTLFYLVAGSLVTMILIKLLRSHQIEVKALLALLFFLYAGLFFLKLLGPTLPFWFQPFYFFTFSAGAFWFVTDMTVKYFYQRYTSKRQITDLKKQRGPFHEIVAAGRLLSRANLGALIVIARKQKLDDWYQKGIRIDAKLSREILFSIFTPPGALHDGATFICRDRVMSGGVIVPLTRNPNISKELGTRHRAGVGFSEACDALCLIVSEETGSISLADRGTLYYDIPFEKLAEVLALAMRFKLKKNRYRSLTSKPEEAPLVFG